MKTFKKAALGALIVLSLVGLNAQNEDWRWGRTAGGTGADMGMAIDTDANGNSFVAGSYTASATFGSHTIPGTGLWDIFVGKLDSAGNWLWVSHAGGSNSSDHVVNVRAITVCATGNIYVTGSFFGNVTFGSHLLVNTGSEMNYDIFVAKLDAAGNWLWAVKAGGVLHEDSQGIATDSAGNVYISGAFLGTCSFGATSLISWGSFDVFYAKLSSAGVWLWAQRVGSDNPNSSDHGYGITLDTQDNIYVTGAFNGTITFGTHSLVSQGVGNGHDIFVCKMTPAGNWLWATRAGGIADDWAYHIQLDAAKNIYISGMYTTAASFGANITLEAISGSFPEVFVAKMDSTATWLWARQAGGHNAISVNGLALDSNSNAYITGSFFGEAEFGPGNSLNSAGNNIYVAKLNMTGAWTMTKQAGGPGIDVGSGISVDSLDYIYVTGYYEQTSSFGSNISLSSAGAADIFVARLGILTPVSDETIPALFSLAQNFPNPFNPSTTINLQIKERAANYMLSIYDIKGRRVRTLVDGYLEPGEHHVVWNGLDDRGQNVASGVYFYRLSGGTESLTRKMILSK